MKLGLDISQHQLRWDELARRARLAEDSGFSGLWVFDHFKALYGDPSGPCLEAWTLLSALGAVTQRIRLGALVTGVTYRHPSVLAAEAVTVDHVSGGRLDIGIGAAWFEQEHRELGIPFPSAPERIHRLEEAVRVMRALMTEDETSFEGRHYQLTSASYNPKPVQRPHPPIWIGASGEQLSLKVVGRCADVWHTFGPVDVLNRRFEIVAAAARRAGRDPSEIARSTSLSISEPFEQVRERARRLADAGISYLIVSWPSEGRDRLDEFIATVKPELDSL
jgi:F420-dependent oxidoreductase-like protein